jgi:hypothetical protein
VKLLDAERLCCKSSCCCKSKDVLDLFDVVVNCVVWKVLLCSQVHLNLTHMAEITISSINSSMFTFSFSFSFIFIYHNITNNFCS